MTKEKNKSGEIKCEIKSNKLTKCKATVENNVIVSTEFSFSDIFIGKENGIYEVLYDNDDDNGIGAYKDYTPPSNDNAPYESKYRGESKRRCFWLKKGDLIKITKIMRQIEKGFKTHKPYEVVKGKVLKRGGDTVDPQKEYYFWIVYEGKKKVQFYGYGLVVELAVEVASVGNVNTQGIFQLIKMPGKDEDLFNVKKDIKEVYKCKEEEKNYFSNRPILTNKMGNICFRVLSKKSKVLSNKKQNEIKKLVDNELQNAEDLFNQELYPTEETFAQVSIFLGDKNLTSDNDKKFEDIENEMKSIKAGINKILIRLNNDGESIQDCIIDGVEFVSSGVRKIKN